MNFAVRISRWSMLLAALVLLPGAAQAAKKGLLRLHMDGAFVEAPVDENNLSAILMGGQRPQQFHELLTKIQKAAKDKDIAGIVMIVENPALGMAQVEELSRELRAFRKAGKRVYAYMDFATNRGYAVASAADHITLAETSEIELSGVHAELSFYKGTLDKLGIVADMIHCGDYKTALEPYTRKEPSKQNAEMVNWLLDGIYEGMVTTIATGRGMKAEDIKAAIDAAPLNAAEALKRKLVDQVGSYPEFQQMLQKEFGKDVELVKKYPRGDDIDLDMSNPFAFFQKLAALMEPKEESSGAGIGLIYVDGGIINGDSEGGQCGSTTIRHALENAMADDQIKAVVLRVNSPGGSALASDIMWKSATRLGKSKPLIVSMGNVAGSGGYYVSIPADTIFAESTTLTGSIGVVGGKMVWKGLWEDMLGVTTTEFDRGKHAGLMSMNRVWNDEERTVITNMMNNIYAQFKERVTTSRGSKIKGELEPLAGGRVYTGGQALKIGLVDKIGGLTDAIALAAEKAGLTDPDVHVLPRKPEPIEVLLRMLGEETPDGWDFIKPEGGKHASAPRGLGRDSRDPLVRALWMALETKAPDALKSKLSGLRDLITIHHEGVGCVMSLYLDIR